jgi:hypothetical protein
VAALLGLALASAACGGGGGEPPPPPPPVAGHTMAVTVNGALCSAANSVAYLNKPCVQVTVCVPGTSTCHVVDDVLLDTGSTGLRLFRQALPLDLPAVTVAGGALASCVQFGDGSSDWGPVVSASVQLGDAGAVTVPIQVIDATYGAVPPACGAPETSPAEAGLNGILGVGVFLEDCGPACAGAPGNGLYYACGAAGCTGTTVPLARQVRNPAAALVGLENGLVVDLAPVDAGGAASAAGEVRFGIGRTADTTPAGVTTYPLDFQGRTTSRIGASASVGLFDTGSNGLFLDLPAGSGPTRCAPPDDAWLCAEGPVALTAQFRVRGGGFGPVTGFEVADALTLFGSGNAVFRNLGGAGFPALGHDWGLPFHLGRKVYVGFEGRSSSLGTGPYMGF